MSTTSHSAHSAATSEKQALHGFPRSISKPNKLPKSLVEFWAKPVVISPATTTTDASSVAASSTTTAATTTSKLRMVHVRNSSKRELQTSVETLDRSAETSQDEVKSQRSSSGRQRLFDSHTTSSSVSSQDTRQKSSLDARPAVLEENTPLNTPSGEDEVALVNSNTNSPSVSAPTQDEPQAQVPALPPKRAFVFVSGDYSEDDDPFATPNHSAHHGNISLASPEIVVDHPHSTSFDSRQQGHASWVWDGETQEIIPHTTVVDVSAYSSTDGRIVDVLETTLHTNDETVKSVDAEMRQTSVCGSRQSQSDASAAEMTGIDAREALDTDMDTPGMAMLTDDETETTYGPNMPGKYQTVKWSETKGFVPSDYVMANVVNDDETETTYGPKMPEEYQTVKWGETKGFVPSDYVMANVVNAANNAIQTASDHFSDMSNSSFPSTMFHSVQNDKPVADVEDSPSRVKEHQDNWTGIAQSPSQADLNRSEFSEGIMANIVSAANAAIQEKADQSTEDSTGTRPRPKHLDIGETPLRSNRQEDCSDAWKRQSPQKPVRSSPPSRRIMNASPKPPSPQSSPLAMRRTLSIGDSKPSIRNEDTDVSFHDDEEDDDESTSASSYFRDDTPGVNFDRLFTALVDFVSPPDDQSSVDTMSTMSRRWQPSFDQASQQDASRASPKPRQVRPDPSNAFLDIRSWWTHEFQTKRTAPVPAVKRTDASTNQAAEIPWLNKFQASMFEQQKSKTNGKVKECEQKSYLDNTSFDALEEIATALKQKKDAKPAGGLRPAHDAISEQFLSLFERLRAGKETAELNSSRNSDDGIEVTIDDSRRPDVLREEEVSLVHIFTKEPGLSTSIDDRSTSPDTAISLPGHKLQLQPISFDGFKNERRTNSLNVPVTLRTRSEPRSLPYIRTDFSISEFIAKDQSFTTPENSVLIHNDDKSLSPIVAAPESPIQVDADLPLSNKSYVNDSNENEEFSNQRLRCQTSAGESSIEQQLRDLYTVVQKHRSAIHLAEISADILVASYGETEDTIYRTPAPTQAKSCKHSSPGQLTPLTADETDTGPDLDPKAHNRQSRVRRRAPKISITTLSGNGPYSTTRNQPSPELGANVFVCSLPPPILPNDMTFGQGPIWNIRPVSPSPMRNSHRHLGRSFESDSGLTHLGYELPLIPNKDQDDEPDASTSPKRRNLLRKNMSSYSIMEDDTVASNNISNDRNYPSVQLRAGSATKETPSKCLLDMAAPLQSDATRGSLIISPGNAIQADESMQKRSSSPRSRKSLFGRQLSLSWLKRPNKQKATYWKKGSILDEESDFNNDSTHDSSFISIHLDKKMVPVRMPFDKLNIDESAEESFYGSLNGYSVESQESSREWTVPPRRTVGQNKTWRPSLQGLDDTWEEDDGPRLENIPPTGFALRARSFQPQTSLRMIHRHSTSPVRRTNIKGKNNRRSVSPQVNTLPVRSFLSRSSSVPDMRGECFVPAPKRTTPPPSTQFRARPMGDISWAPPQRVTIMKQQRNQQPPQRLNTSTSSEYSYTVPPAATWEEFNGFSFEFWQPQEI
jgi:hypothetical protein